MPSMAEAAHIRIAELEQQLADFRGRDFVKLTYELEKREVVLREALEELRGYARKEAGGNVRIFCSTVVRLVDRALEVK